MRRIDKYIVAFLSIVALTGCDYFEPEYTGNITEEQYGDKLNNLRFGLNAIYNVMQSKDYQVSELLFGEACSDNMWNKQDCTTGSVYDVVNFTFDTENSYILKRYQVNYEGINKANQVIRRIGLVKSKNIPATQKEIREVYGQAKLLRALFYFNLVRTYGGVSIQPETTSMDSLKIPRSTEQETYAYIERDIRESLLLLRKQRYAASEAGQLDMSAGLGLLMKVLLYEASPGIKTADDIKRQKWYEAKEIGEFFIDGSRDLSIRELLKYDEATYGETWEQLRSRLLLDSLSTLDSKVSSSEVVNEHHMIAFEQVYHLEGESSAENLIEINHYDYSGTGASADEAWKLYDNMLAGGSPIFATCSNAVYNLMNKDPRQVFVVDDAKKKNNYTTKENQPEFSKGIGDGKVYTKYLVFPSEGASGGRNYRVMRYPEVLLIYAEVLNELGDQQRAIDLVNRIRQRARELFHSDCAVYIKNVTEANFKDASVGPKDQVNEIIWNEKRIEMCGEYDRWYEICRLDKCSECQLSLISNAPMGDNESRDRIRGKYFKKGINERFPIPQKEIYIASGVIEQNPGY